ncbi:uncharacterized protein LOC110711047 [Chenopodium quinoa]|uniref:uncharacterized protein LOC110711047 n=1 Tax=Chenopodium quinoa TaxID=63459 RepID=UPI000B777EFE|nr:uncharacterized protein LOC110711047 [Chenopodium quinoa]
MSFLAGRLAGKEAAYFFEESKHAVSRLAEKTSKSSKTPIHSNSNSESAAPPDILPEILRHSLPAKIYRTDLSSDSSLSTSAKWALPNSSNASHSSVSPDVLNPLTGFLSLPQVTFGPKRWQLPTPQSSVTASTANDLRLQHQTHINPEKARAAAEGLSHIGKAFAVATAIIFGTAALTFGFFASQLQLHNTDDIRIKGRDLVRPKFENIKEQLHPLKDWAENTSKKWHLKNEQDIKERPIVKELSKILRAKDSA